MQPNGSFNVNVPPGVRPGDVFHVHLPAALPGMCWAPVHAAWWGTLVHARHWQSNATGSALPWQRKQRHSKKYVAASSLCRAFRGAFSSM